MLQRLASDPGLIVCIVAVAAIVVRLAWRSLARRGAADLGWDDLQRESKRTPRRYVRESTTTTNVQPLVTRVPGSRITNHLPPRPHEPVAAGE